MESNAVETVGERWREADFRSAVATDLALGAIARRLPPPRQPAWVDNWSSGVPVRFWHGRHEAATHYSAVRAVADRRPDWHVTTVAGCSALLGTWPDLLQHAEESFGLTQPQRRPPGVRSGLSPRTGRRQTVAALIDSTSGRLVAMVVKLSPPSLLANTVPDRVPK